MQEAVGLTTFRDKLGGHDYPSNNFASVGGKFRLFPNLKLPKRPGYVFTDETLIPHPAQVIIELVYISSKGTTWLTPAENRCDLTDEWRASGRSRHPGTYILS